MQQLSEAQRHPVMFNALKGAVAGAAAVWVMDRVGWYMYLREDEDALRRERDVRPNGLDTAHNMAASLAGLLGRQLKPAQPNGWGIGMHYALGMLPGALYGVLRHRVKGLSGGQGTLYGLGLFLLEDEVGGPALGLASGPLAYPWQAHMRGLVSHLVLGMVTDGVLRVMDRELHPSASQAPASDARDHGQG